MKKILVIVLLVMVYSCSEKKKEKLSYVKHSISFLNRDINIPENYIQVSFDEYGKLIKETYSDSIFISSKLKSIEKIKASSPEYSMFCDKNNIENTLTILFMVNPRVTKQVKTQLSHLIVAQMRDKGAKENFVYQNMQNKMIDDWIIKIKGKQTYDSLGVVIYSTQYMASNFGAYVFSDKKDFDFEKELTE